MNLHFGTASDPMHFNMSLGTPTGPDPTAIHGSGITNISLISAADYEALGTYSTSTLYVVSQTDGTFRLYLGETALWENPRTVHSDTVATISRTTQEDYDALETKDEGTMYFICDSESEYEDESESGDASETEPESESR